MPLVGADPVLPAILPGNQLQSTTTLPFRPFLRLTPIESTPSVVSNYERRPQLAGTEF